MSELKKCPFCGGEAVVHNLGVDIQCSVCGAKTAPSICTVNGKKACIVAWNLRADTGIPATENDHIGEANKTIEHHENDGLKAKYNVFKVSDGSAVCDCFVLRPGKDPAAVAALRAYAAATDNKVLADDIYHWVGQQENAPLTLDELRGMDGQPVWVETADKWGLIHSVSRSPFPTVHYFTKSGFFATVLFDDEKFYRQKPEGGQWK